jgi:nucleoside-diphosphate-sugar epimerase
MAVYLITGCAGFIGSHLSEKLLSEGHQVIGIDNFDPFYARCIKEKNLQTALKSTSFTFYEMDIASPKLWEQIHTEIDCVIHLAAKAGVRPSIEDPEGYIQTNIIGTQLLLSWMTKHQHKNLVFASSSSVYGNNKKIPFSETDNVDFPISPYAYTKKACEQMIYTYHHLYQINALCLRFFTVYGPRQRPDLAIHKFTHLMHEQQPITLFGDGSTARDYTYVEDTVNGILKSIQYLGNKTEVRVYEIINLGNNQPVELKVLVDELKIAAKREVQIQRLPMQPGDVDITYADIEKAKKLLGYQPNTSIRDGLKKFMDWYESN